MYRLRILTTAIALCAAPAVSAQSDVAGHYYLQGVMETGSELLLKPDGRFEWYMSYGAVDQTASGTWTRKGNVVELNAAGADKGKPLYTVDAQQDWDSSMEQALLDREREREFDVVAQRCPLNQIAMAASPTPFPMDTPDPKALKAAADASVVAEKAARATAEKAAALAIAILGKPDAEERLAVAREAISQWESSRYEMESAHRLAGLDAPQRTDLRLPAACNPPPEKRVDRDHPERWQGGIVISIADPEMGVAPKGVNVTLTYTDGTTATAPTASRGWALFPRKAGVTAGRVHLEAPFATGREMDLDFTPLERGLQAINIDARQLMASPFETMRLRVDGRELLPENMGRGRYVREGN